MFQGIDYTDVSSLIDVKHIYLLTVTVGMHAQEPNKAKVEYEQQPGYST